MRHTIRFLLASAVLVALAMTTGCTAAVPRKPFQHTLTSNCPKCHESEAKLWSSQDDQHAASALTILAVVDHNKAEVPKDDCLLCHSMFQAVSLHAIVDPKGKTAGTKIPKSAYGPVDDPSQTYYSGAVTHFVIPADQKGPWVTKNESEWEATRCQVCHDPSLNTRYKLAKYGAWLDSQPTAGYVQLNTGMPTAYNYVAGDKGYTKHPYTYQLSTSASTVKLCDSCHDPDDQGGDPAKIIGGRNYGPQGGDSRSYVTANHADFACVGCHQRHDFVPVSANEAKGQPSCTGLGCHSARQPLPKSATDPGVVHTNHIP